MQRHRLVRGLTDSALCDIAFLTWWHIARVEDLGGDMLEMSRRCFVAVDREEIEARALEGVAGARARINARAADVFTLLLPPM